MENKETVFSEEEWIKIIRSDIPEGKYIVTRFVQDLDGTKILLDNGEHNIEVFFDGIPVLVRNTIEGLRMRTWGNVQLKYNDKSIFRNSFFFEVKKSDLVKWCVRESCGFYEEHQLKHYCIITSEELIDIIASFEPILRILK